MIGACWSWSSRVPASRCARWSDPTWRRPGRDVLMRVRACGVCRTDLHLLDGEVGVPEPPRVLGHQIVGEVLESEELRAGARVGVPWLGWTTGHARTAPGAREPLPRRPLHGPRSRRRLRRARGGRLPLLPPDPRRLPGPLGRTAAVLRLDRLPVLRLTGDGERLGSGDSARRRTSSAQVAVTRDEPCSRSPRPATRRRRSSPGGWARRGRAARTRRRRRSSTPR